MAAGILGNCYTIEIDTLPNKPDLYWIYLFRCCVFKLNFTWEAKDENSSSRLRYTETSLPKLNSICFSPQLSIFIIMCMFSLTSQNIFIIINITFIVFANYIIFNIFCYIYEQFMAFLISLIIMIKFTWSFKHHEHWDSFSEIVKSSHGEY